VPIQHQNRRLIQDLTHRQVSFSDDPEILPEARLPVLGGHRTANLPFAKWQSRQINALSNLGLLSRFVGMLTDSRSFMSFPRHEYFRRTLCNLIGRDIESGELPEDYDLVGSMVRNICFQNAQTFLRLG
jgi:hypothetical protein